MQRKLCAGRCSGCKLKGLWCKQNRTFWSANKSLENSFLTYLWYDFIVLICQIPFKSITFLNTKTYIKHLETHFLRYQFLQTFIQPRPSCAEPTQGELFPKMVNRDGLRNYQILTNTVVIVWPHITKNMVSYCSEIIEQWNRCTRRWNVSSILWFHFDTKTKLKNDYSSTLKVF